MNREFDKEGKQPIHGMRWLISVLIYFPTVLIRRQSMPLRKIFLVGIIQLAFGELAVAQESIKSQPWKPITVTKSADHKLNGGVSEGTFSVLNYNVAGQKDLDYNGIVVYDVEHDISQTFPSIIESIMSRNYEDIVLMQEVWEASAINDYWDSEFNANPGLYPYRSNKITQTKDVYDWGGCLVENGGDYYKCAYYLGTGLYRFSKNQDYSVVNEYYDNCNDEDCLAKKGWDLAVHKVGTNDEGEDVFIHVYNTHVQSRSTSSSANVRRKQLEELRNAIEYNSIRKGHAVILAGDFNALYSRDNDDVQDYFEGFTTWRYSDGRALKHVLYDMKGWDYQQFEGDNDAAYEKGQGIEHCFYMSSEEVELIPIEFNDVREDFGGSRELDTSSSDPVYECGWSDHPPIRYTFSYATDFSNTNHVSKNAFKYKDYSSDEERVLDDESFIGSVSDNGGNIFSMRGTSSATTFPWDISMASEFTVEFEIDTYDNWDDDDTFKFLYSIDNGATWITAISKDGKYNNNYYTISVDIPRTGAVYFKFESHADENNEGFNIRGFRGDGKVNPNIELRSARKQSPYFDQQVYGVEEYEFLDAYYLLDGNTNDEEGNLDATAQGISYEGNYATFDGVNDYIDVPDFEMDYSGGFTFAGWVKIDTKGPWQRIFDFGRGENNYNVILARYGTQDYLTFSIREGSSHSGTNSSSFLELNKWIHIAVTVDAVGTVKFYKNGYLDSQGSVTLPRGNKELNKNYIGRSNWSRDPYFDGAMYELRFLNEELTAREVLELYDPEPIARYEFNLNADDSHGANHGTAMGGVDLTLANNLERGNVALFDGNVSNYINLPDLKLDLRKGFSFTGWVHWGGTRNAHERVFQFYDATNNGGIFLTRSGNSDALWLNVVNDAGDPQYIKANGFIEENEWMHIGVTIDIEGNVVFYKNGEVAPITSESSTVTLPSITNRSYNYLGRTGSGNDPFEGMYDNFTFYNHGLLEWDVEADYDETSVVSPLQSIHYAFDGNTSDSEGNYDGIPKGGVSTTLINDGQRGSVAEFNNDQNGYIEMPPVGLNLNEGFTFTGWVFFDGSSSDFEETIFDLGNGVDRNNIQLSRVGTSNDLRLMVWDNGTRHTLEAKDFIESNKWIHIACKVARLGYATIFKNGSTYVDGNGNVAQEHFSTTDRYVLRLRNHVGSAEGALNASHFNGKMDDLRFHARDLTDHEIRDSYRESASVVGAYYPFSQANTFNDARAFYHASGKGDVTGSVSMEPYSGQVTREFVTFDGNGDYIELPEMSMDLADGFSFAAWVRFDSQGRWERIFDFGNGSNADNIVFARLSDGSQLIFNVRDGAGVVSTVTSNKPIVQGEWTHYAATLSPSGTVKLYVNGVLDNDENATAPLPTGAIKRDNNYLGRSNWSADDYFEGAMDEVYIINEELKPEDIAHLYATADNNEILHYTLDADASDTYRKHDGTLRGGVQLDYDVHQTRGLVASFNSNSNGYIELPKMALQLSSGFTFAGWVSPTGNGDNYERIFELGLGPNNRNILLQRNNTSNQWTLRFLNGENGAGDNVYTFTTGSDFIPSNTWTHIACVIDGNNGTLQFYKNGSTYGSPRNFQALDDEAMSYTHNYLGGSSWPEDAYYGGMMDDVYIFNHPLTKAEVQALIINYSPAAYYPFTTNAQEENRNYDGTFRNEGSRGGGKKVTFPVPKTSATNVGILQAEKSYVELPRFDIDLSTGFTFSGWVVFNEFRNGWERIFELGEGAPYDNIVLARHANSKRLTLEVYDGQNSSTLQTTEDVIELGNWAHYAVTIEPDGMASIYVNGVEKGSSGSPLTHVPSGVVTRTNNYLGRSQRQAGTSDDHKIDYAFHGMMDQVRIMDYAVPDTEISTLYVCSDAYTNYDFYVQEHFTNSAISSWQAGPMGVTFDNYAVELGFFGSVRGSVSMGNSSEDITVTAWVKNLENNTGQLAFIFENPDKGIAFKKTENVNVPKNSNNWQLISFDINNVSATDLMIRNNDNKKIRIDWVAVTKRNSAVSSCGANFSGRIAEEEPAKEVLGVEEQSSQVAIYPNPTEGMLQVQLPEGSYELKVVDMAGRLYQKIEGVTGQHTLDLTELPASIYLLRVKGPDDFKKVQQVIVR